MKRNQWIFTILFVICAATFLFCAWQLGTYFYEGYLNDQRLNEIANQVQNSQTGPQPTVYFTRPEPTDTTAPTEENADPTDAGTEPTEATEATEDTPPVILAEYAQLYLDNSDLVGWISIEGTSINYPVMQTPQEKDYYLYRNFDGKQSSRGCIYADEECDVFAPSDNITIYGHHMKDGSMFTALTRYNSSSFLREHPYITFDTLLEHHTYEIIAVFTTTATVGQGFRYNAFIDAATPEEFDEYVSTCKRLSLYDIEATAEYGDKLITLSTCEYTQINGRFVVVAKRIETTETQP